MAQIDPKRVAVGRRLGTAEEELEHWIGHVEQFCVSRATFARSGPVRLSELKGSVRLDERDFRTMLSRLADKGLVYLFADEPGARPERRRSVRVPSIGDVYYILWLGRRRTPANGQE